MNPTPPDDPPKPEVNPYEAPQTTSPTGNGLSRGVKGGLLGCIIVPASLVAFVATCVPVGAGLMQSGWRFLSDGAIFFASLIGLIVAGLVGVGLARVFGRKQR